MDSDQTRASLSGDATQDLAARAAEVLQAAGLDPEICVWVMAPMIFGFPVCRQCGCTDWTACEVGCFWVEDDLCSACMEPTGRKDP